MIHWNESITIAASIETVWSLFADKNIRRIMPKVDEHVLIEKTEGEVGAKHRQSYREGNRVETYIVETLAYEDREDEKRKQIHFLLANMFETTLTFTLRKIDDTHTSLTYEGQNEGVNFAAKAMLKLSPKKSNDKVIQDFLRLVEQEATKVEV
ncbi:MAG TPA: SRPBCC family protein [Bacilli bacterium]|nr:SRPBCC family protein [Bacilli bacterium]